MRLQTLNNPLTARAETSAIQIESSSRSGGIEPSLSALQVMHRLLTRLCWQMAPLSTLCNCAFADCAGRCSTLRTPSTCEIRCFLEETKGSSCRKSRPKCHPATSTRGRCHMHSLHLLLIRRCWQMLPPPHSLHLLLCWKMRALLAPAPSRLCWQMLAPPHSLHWLLDRFSHIVPAFPLMLASPPRCSLPRRRLVPPASCCPLHSAHPPPHLLRPCHRRPRASCPPPAQHRPNCFTLRAISTFSLGPLHASR